MVRLALAGDTMLGRTVAARLAETPPATLWSQELASITNACDAFVLNLECCISERGKPWADPRKPFFFRAPPAATEALAALGVDAVTLANNHALDYGPQALADTCAHLDAVGIAFCGAGADVVQARRPALLEVGNLRVAVVGAADHPADFAAGERTAGIAFADLHHEVPAWLEATLQEADAGADVVVAMPHWGPNMVAEPVAHVRAGAPALVEAGATVVAGHSAHVFHGVARVHGRPVLYDLGDFVDDYAVHPTLRNDQGLLWLLDLDGDGLHALEAVPLALDHCHTRVATGAEATAIAERLTTRCARMGTGVRFHTGRLLVELDR